MKIHERIRIIRKSKGLTQVFVAKQLNYPTSTYNAYELGNRVIKADQLKKFADALSVPVEIFFDDSFFESKKLEGAS